MMLALVLGLQLATATAVDPFAFFQPSVTVTESDRADLDRGNAIARVVPSEGHHVAVFAAIRVDIDGDRLVRWMRRIDELKKSSYVLSIARFSDPPRLDDLAALTLDDDDVDDLAKCRAGKCGLKLSAADMAELQRAARGEQDPQAVQEAFRRVMLRRVDAYQRGDDTPYEDHSTPVSPSAQFAQVLAQSAFLRLHVPAFADQLARYPRAPGAGIESFMYWSKERLASKATISITHVNIMRGEAPAVPEVLVAGKEVFATHYLTASLGITALVRAPDGSRYLVYINRSDVDMLGGMFGPVVKWFVQRRLKGEAASVLQALRKRLESGDPPPAPYTTVG